MGMVYFPNQLIADLHGQLEPFIADHQLSFKLFPFGNVLDRTFHANGGRMPISHKSDLLMHPFFLSSTGYNPVFKALHMARNQVLAWITFHQMAVIWMEGLGQILHGGNKILRRIFVDLVGLLTPHRYFGVEISNPVAKFCNFLGCP